MICQNCGKELSDKSKFCKYCGAEVKAVPPEETVPSPDVQDTRTISENALIPDTTDTAEKNNSPMLCRNCGKELSGKSKFCKYCGAPADIPAAETVAPLPEALPVKRMPKEKSVPYNPGIQETAPENQNNDVKKSPDYKLLFIISSIIAVLAIIGIVLAIIMTRNVADTEIKKLQDMIDSKDAVIRSNNTQISSLENEVKEYKYDSIYYNNIVDFIQSSKAVNNYKDYYSDSNIYFVQKGESKTVTIHIKYGGTISYDAGSETAVSCEWGDWVNTTAPITFTGKREGSQLVHFTKKGTDENFYILVVCIP